MEVSQTNGPKLQPWDHYVQGVLGGVIVSCEYVKAACRRHLNDLARVPDESFSYRFSVTKAERAVKFFRSLMLTKGLPKPKSFKLEPWQAFIVASLFGWVRKDNGMRRFRRAHIMVARKNGKSHLLAGIGLFGLIADGEFGAEIYSAATTRDQAKMIFDAALDFRKFSGDMNRLVQFKNYTLYMQSTSSKFKALSSDSSGMDGLNVHIGLIDELQNHTTDDVYERITTATAGRLQPLIITISTAGTDRLSLCGREHGVAIQIVSGDAADETYFAYLAEADEGDDWEDEEVWKKANPNLGVSVNIEDLRSKAVAAKNDPSKLNSFKRLHLNIWTQQEHVYIPMHRWRECVGEVKMTDEDGKIILVNPRDRQAVEDAMITQWRLPFGGADLSSKTDITAIVNLFPPAEQDPHWIVTCRFFVPEDHIGKRSKNDRVPYDIWVRDGLMTATAGETVDYDFVRAEITKMHRRLHYQGVGFDPWQALQLMNQLKADAVPVLEVTQGVKSLSDPTKELLAWVMSRKIYHLGDPVLNWMAGNMAVKMDAAGNVKPDKEHARERMDGMSALVNAIFLALSRAVSVYSNRGIISI